MQKSNTNGAKRVLFMAGHYMTLFATRRELIRRLCEEGHEVYLSIPDTPENKYFADMGCRIIDTKIERRGTNPLRDISLLRFYKRMIAEVDPDIIFSYAIKPNIYGSMTNKGKYRQICNITGTGATFLKQDLVSMLCRYLYRYSITKCYKVFFQNYGDKDYFVKHKMVGDNYEILPGSGCNLEEYRFSEMPLDDETRFIFIARVMKLKGIDEYLACAKAIKTKYPNTTFYIAGDYEEAEYKTIIDDYEKQGYIKYLGFRNDIADLIKKCHCTILPSHGGEGVPNALLETSAIGRVCIGSRIEGTMDVIDDGVTGFLFQTYSSDDLIEKVERVLNLSYAEKRQMGLNGRKKVEKEFDRKIVVNAYMEEINKLK